MYVYMCISIYLYIYNIAYAYATTINPTIGRILSHLVSKLRTCANDFKQDPVLEAYLEYASPIQ